MRLSRASKNPWFVAFNCQISSALIVVGAPILKKSRPVLPLVVRVRCEKSRSIVGEYFDNVLVDKYAQFEILAGGQICNCKRSLGGADAQSAGVGPQHDRETTVASTTKSVVRIL